MLSIKAVNNLGRLVNTGHYFLGMHPFYLDKRSQRFAMNGSVKHKIQYWFQLIVIILFQVFVAVRSIQAVLNEKEIQKKKVRAVYVTFAVLIANSAHIVTIKNYHSLHNVLNAFMDVTTAFAGKHHSHEDKKESARCECFLSFVVFMWFFTSMINPILSIVAPSQPNLLTSLAPHPNELPLWIRALVGYVHFRIFAFQTGFSYMYISVVVSYIFAVLPMIRRLGAEGMQNQNPTSCGKLLNFRSLSKHFTELRVLQNNFNAVMGGFVLGVDVLCMYMCIANAAQAVIFRCLRCLGLAAGVLMIAVQAFEVFGQAHEVSSAMLVGWQSIPYQPKWFPKYRKTCQPLKITIGSFFYVDRGFILTFLGTIVCKAADIVVTHKVD